MAFIAVASPTPGIEAITHVILALNACILDLVGIRFRGQGRDGFLQNQTSPKNSCGSEQAEVIPVCHGLMMSKWLQSPSSQEMGSSPVQALGRRAESAACRACGKECAA